MLSSNELNNWIVNSAIKLMASTAAIGAIAGAVLSAAAMTAWNHNGDGESIEDREAIVQTKDYHCPSELLAAKSTIATVVKVYDGDTLSVKVDGWPDILTPIAVRIARIDCPEIKDKRSEMSDRAIAARAETMGCCPVGGEIRLTGIKRDKYFRILASVSYKSGNGYRSLSDHLIDMQLAKPYDGSGPKPW